MPRSRAKSKGRRESGSFVAVPHVLLNHPNYLALSSRAKAMFWDLVAQFTGKNNGDLCAAYSIMKERGWRSNDQKAKAISELVEAGFIVVSRQGYRPRVATLYALTFLAVDECSGKLDIPATTAPLGTWKN